MMQSWFATYFKFPFIFSLLDFDLTDTRAHVFDFKSDKFILSSFFKFFIVFLFIIDSNSQL